MMKAVAALGYTSNARGQQTTSTNAEGNLTIYVRYPENNPDGDDDVHDPHLSNHQYGRLKQMVADGDPSTVMTLVGEDGDMSTFIGNLIPRTNTPGVYQNLTTTHQGPSGCTSCNYDPLGNVLQLQTQQHLRTDGEGTEPIVSTVTTKQAYDSDNRLTKLTDSNGGTTQWTYDTLDRQVEMIFHDGSTRLYGYDAASDVTSYTDENQSVRTSTFDPLGRKTDVSLTLASGVQGTTAQSFQYDGLRRMTFCRDTIVSANADAAFTFDSLGRVVEEGQTYGGDTRYVTNDQWMSLPSTDLTYPNGQQVSMGYDALYRKNAINETSTSASIAAWQFFGPRTATVTLGNGITTSFMDNAQSRSAVQFGQTTPGWGDITTDHLGYDGAGRLIGKRHFNGASVLVGNTSAYDKSSNKLFERALHAESRSNLYPSNDSMNRLLEYQRGVLASGGGSITTPISLPNTNQEQDYDFDALSNWSTTTITPEGGSPAVQTRVHNKLNEITQYAATPVLYDHGNNTTPHASRGNGNIADDGVRTYAYDAMNRLTTVSRKNDGATIGQYTYDAIGRRLLKVVSNGGITGTVANGTYRYISDGQQIVEELNASNSTTRQFVWGQYIDELIQMKTYVSTGGQPLPAGIYYLLSDLLYRSIALTNSGGSIVEAYDTDAYGYTLIYSTLGTDNIWFTNDDLQSAQPACETIFQGRQQDPETQVYFFNTRYYMPSLGRFISRDSLPYFDGPNLYEYERNNPVTHLDYSGRGCQTCWLDDLSFSDQKIKVTDDGGPGGIEVGVTFSVNVKWHRVTNPVNVSDKPVRCRLEWWEYGSQNLRESTDPNDRGPIVAAANTWIRFDNRDDAKAMFDNYLNEDWSKSGDTISITDTPGGGVSGQLNTRWWAIRVTSSAARGPSKTIYAHMKWGYGPNGVAGGSESEAVNDIPKPPGLPPNW